MVSVWLVFLRCVLYEVLLMPQTLWVLLVLYGHASLYVLLEAQIVRLRVRFLLKNAQQL